MPSFKDTNGKEWLIAINVGVIRRVRLETSINLMELNQGEPPLAVRLLTDPEALTSIIFSIVGPRAKEQGLDAEAFYESMGGPQVLEAYEAISEALTDFFRQSGRKELATVLQAARRQMRAQIEVASQKVEALEANPPTSGNTSTSSPESSG